MRGVSSPSTSSSSTPSMPEYTSLPTTSDASPLVGRGGREKPLPAGASTSRGRHDGRPAASRRRLALLAVGSALGLAGLAALSRTEGVTHRVKGMVVDRVGYDARGRPVVDFEAEDLPEEFRCNPFKERGRLAVDVENPSETVWRPYDETCPPSRLMRHLMPSADKQAAPATPHRMARALRRHRKSTNGGAPRLLPDDLVADEGEDRSEEPVFLPWLVNATILLQGDSIERLHINDFCNLVGGTLHNIDPNHPASPPLYHKPMPTLLDHNGNETAASKAAKSARAELELSWQQTKAASWPYTRPWVCDLGPRYNATVLSVFAWGMEDYEPIYQSEDFFHGPSTWIDRFHHITLPLLQNVAAWLDRPQVARPTVVEVSSGFWDLRGLTEMDFLSRGVNRPYPTDSDLPFGPIGDEREHTWTRHAGEMLEAVARAFPGPAGAADVRGGPPISWRTLHQPKRNNYTPYSRVFALDQLARKLVHDLRAAALLRHPNLYRSAVGALGRTRDALLAKAGREAGVAVGGRDYGFDERLRVNEIGRLLTGQDNYFKDFLHPNPVPGSFLWGEIILYEVKRAVAGAGRSAR